MNTENFAGKNGFIWWVGELENRVDPLAIGRCQVRIFGWHSINKQLVPTEDLPWAHPMYPLNNSKSFAAPRVGDWIVGFFLDGENAQQPVMMGILPGMKVTEFDDKISKIVVVGDSIAVGLSTSFPKALVDAVVGRSTGTILSAVIANKALQNADLAIVSSGTNDYPLANKGINPNPQATIANIQKTKNTSTSKTNNKTHTKPKEINTKQNTQSKKTHCVQGHSFDETNTIWRPSRRTGLPARHCRTCIKAWKKKYRNQSLGR
jgi:hypothetical protein